MRLRALLLASPALLAFAYLVACSGGTDGPGNGSGSSGAAGLDGTWDVVSYEGGEIGPSYVTLANGKLTGKVEENEPGGCTATLEFAIEGDSMVGVFTPGGDECSGERPITLNGTRTTRKPDSDTPWNGTWHLKSRGDEGDLVISGLTAKATDDKDFSLSIAGGLATATGRNELSFVARRR